MDRSRNVGLKAWWYGKGTLNYSARRRPNRRVAAVPLAMALLVGACSAQLPKAPPPPSTSHGVTTTVATAPTTAASGTGTRAGNGHAGGNSTAATGGTRAGAVGPPGGGRTSSPGASGTGASSSTGVGGTAAATTVAPPPTTATVPYNSDAVASVAVGSQPHNWNIHAAAAVGSYATLKQVLSEVWPSAFVLAPNGAEVMNSSLLKSATEVSTHPQRVVYKLNPRAVWSDGVPITYRDFQYNWEAQSGRLRFTDTGGRPFDAADTQGYHRIASVSGTPGDPYTVTVTFLGPYAAWRSLFSYLMPAHVAQRVGFAHGFTDPAADLVSGGPYMVSQWQQGYSVELVRNARYWATPANLATLTFYFTSGPAQILNSVSQGQLDLAETVADPQLYQQLSSASGMVVTPVASNYYEDLDFNERSRPLSSGVLRQAIMMAVDRGSLASEVLGPYGLPTSPVQNRAQLPGTASYQANGASFGQSASAGQQSAIKLLETAGYRMKGGQLYTAGGALLQLTLYVPVSNPPSGNTSGSGAPAGGASAGGASAGGASAGRSTAELHTATSSLGAGTAAVAGAGPSYPGGHPMGRATSTTPTGLGLSAAREPGRTVQGRSSSTTQAVTSGTKGTASGPLQAVAQHAVQGAGQGMAQGAAQDGAKGSAVPELAPAVAGSASAVEAACKALGIAVTVHYGARTPGEVPGSDTAVTPPAGWQMAIVLRHIPYTPAALVARYRTGGLGNIDGYSSPAMNSLLASVEAAGPGTLPGLLQQVDARAWSDFVDLPLVQVPDLVIAGHNLLNVDPGAYLSNIGWNEADWGFAAR